MKNQQFITGFLAASCLFLLISSTIRQSPITEAPRYHLTWTAGGAGYVYDAVTGKYKLVKYNRFNDEGNLKEILDRPEK